MHPKSCWAWLYLYRTDLSKQSAKATVYSETVRSSM